MVAFTHFGVGMLGHTYRNLFGNLRSRSIIYRVVYLLRIVRQPRPFVLSGVPSPAEPMRERLFQFAVKALVLILIGQYKGLSVPIEPVFVILGIGIIQIIKIIHHIITARMGHEDQLRRFQPQALAPVDLVHDHSHIAIVGIGVGDIEEIEVYSRIHQHLHVLRHNKGITA